MKDFTLSCYNNKLWISNLLSSSLEHGKFYIKRSNNMLQNVRFVSIFGTIVEMKLSNENCTVFSVDDGSGTINCRYSAPELLQQVEDWTWKIPVASEEREVESTLKGGDGSSLYDTVFNDRTLQKDDISVADAQSKALESLRWSVVKSLLTSQLSVGDIVCVHGRLYSYFGNPQIYVNVIRHMEMDEELSLSLAKLDTYGKECIESATSDAPNETTSSKANSGKQPSVSHNSILVNDCKPTPSASVETSLLSQQRRKSGLMTFDTLGGAHRLSVAPMSSPTAVNLPIDLYVPPCSATFATYDTFDLLEEETSESNSEDDAFIPSTP